MNLVSNFIGEISASQFGGKSNGVNSNLDLNDNTFANLLEKQLNNTADNNNLINNTDNLGILTGINIGDFDGRIPQFSTENKINQINEIGNTASERYSNPKEFSTSEILTFFASLFDSKPTLTQTASNGLFDFERKFAANSYGKYAKNIILDLGEFVTDTIRSKS